VEADVAIARAREDSSGPCAVALRPAGSTAIGLRATASLVTHLTVRQLRSTNHLTLLGWGWPVARQLAQLAVLVFVFGSIFNLDVENYPVFVFIGLVAWTWFGAGLSAAATSVLGQRHLVMQPRLPTAILPMVAIAVPLVDTLFAVPVLVLMLALSSGLTWGLLVVPLLLVLQGVLMAGLAWLVAAVSVFLRDIPNLVAVVLLMLFYLTPVFYGRTSVPERFRWVLDLNPMGTLIEAHRALLLGEAAPSTLRLAGLAVVSLALAAGGLAAFRRLETRFADQL